MQQLVSIPEAIASFLAASKVQRHTPSLFQYGQNAEGDVRTQKKQMNNNGYNVAQERVSYMDAFQ